MCPEGVESDMKLLRLFALFLLLVSFAPLALGDGLRLADPKVLAELRQLDQPVPPASHFRPLPPTEAPDFDELVLQAPDVTFLRTFAEYETNAGILMRWRPGVFNTELASMIVPITTGDSRAVVYLVVRPGGSDQQHAENWLGSAGANLERVEFVDAPNDSVWIRDYGPRFVSADFQRVIIDHTYEGAASRPNDNAVPGFVANHLGEQLYTIPLVHGGGNYHQFATGEGFVTDSILNRNPGMSAQQVTDLFALYQGAEVTLLGSLPQSFDGTQHLDMWFMPVDDDTVIINDYSNPPPDSEWIPPEVINVTEAAVAEMLTRGFEVKRIPAWRATNPQPWGSFTHMTYSNNVVLNDVVITCEYPGYDQQNTAVLNVMTKAFPERNVVAIDCSNIIHSFGALHCVVKHMPETEQFGARPPYYDWNR
jgi:agmatine deiminase